MTMLPEIPDIDPEVSEQLGEFGEGNGQCRECYSYFIKLHEWPWTFRTCDCECWALRTKYDYRTFNMCPWGRA